MRRFLFFSPLTSLTFALPTTPQEAKPSGLTIPALHPTAQSPDILSFFASAPRYIAKAFSYSDTACSISRVLPIFCGEHTLDQRQAVEMADEEPQTCGSGFEGWVCSVTAHTALIAFVFLIFAPLLALGIYKWKKVCVSSQCREGTVTNNFIQSKRPGKKLPLPLSEPQPSDGYSQVEEIRSKWMPMSPL